ncbi:MAG: formate--tetrahydrofolate ligase [Lachnospiraceae bacterium]
MATEDLRRQEGSSDSKCAEAGKAARGYGLWQLSDLALAKTQYSLTDDQTKLGAPTDFEVTVRNLKVSQVQALS